MLSLLATVALAQSPPVAAEMHERFSHTMQIRQHLIQGDMEEAQKLAATLVDPTPVEGLPAGWAAATAKLHAEATALSKATDVGVAAKHLSQLASACAECHALTDGGPGLDGMRGVPPQQWSEGDNMPLHLWAVDWMWLGLVAPNDEAWDRGVAELDSKPLAAMFGENEPTAQKLEKQVYALAKKAGELGPAKHTERAEIMGELLATCATCHVLRDQKSDEKK